MDSNSRELCAFWYRHHVPLLLASEVDLIMLARLRNEHTRILDYDLEYKPRRLVDTTIIARASQRDWLHGERYFNLN
jgi:hypothetical protein